KWRPPDRIEQRRSGLPADAAGRRVRAERPRLDGTLEVLPQRGVRCPDYRDALANPAAHSLAGALRLVAQFPCSSAQARSFAQLIDQGPSFRLEPRVTFRVVLGLGFVETLV